MSTIRVPHSEKQVALRLSVAMSLFQTSTVLVATIAGLIGYQLAPDKQLATLPVAAMWLSAACSVLPAAALMRNFGRKSGFLVGTACGCISGALAAASLIHQSFWLFALATSLMGCYQCFAQYYRYTAADLASESFKSRAISWVVAGGVVAAVAGPAIARFTAQVTPVPFLASYLVLMSLGAVAFLLILSLRLPDLPAKAAPGAGGRSLVTILSQRDVLVALGGTAIAYIAMTGIMTATPIAMQLCGLPVAAVSTVILWHVLGMFGPSFVTGSLIRKFGAMRMMSTGIALLAAHVAIAVSGSSFAFFASGLVLVGVGWNFLFVGSTTVLTGGYRAEERDKVQAAGNFAVFLPTTIASFFSGDLLHVVGWRTLNLVALPFIAAMALVLVLVLIRQHAAVAAQRQPSNPRADVTS